MTDRWPLTYLLDPANPTPVDRLERTYRIKHGPHQPRLFSYPKKNVSGKNRSFRFEWFQSFEWLEYSESKDAAFCFCCRMFNLNSPGMMGGGGGGGGGQRDTTFSTTGFKTWHNAPSRFANHERTVRHQNSWKNWYDYTNA